MNNFETGLMVILTLCYFFALLVISWLYVKHYNRCLDLEHEVNSWKAQSSYLAKKLDEQKVKVYNRAEMNLKQAMIQQTQADISKRLQSYLSTEGIYT